MSQENQDQPMVGKAVAGAGQAVETVATQVESAAVQATEFASDNVLARLLGYIRAAKEIVDAGLEGGIDTLQAGRAGVSEFSDKLLAEMDEVREATEQALKKAAGGGK
jgi:hypothetical protein